MGAQPKRGRLSSAERKIKIVDAAIALFARKGYEATSIDDIAVEAHITKPVVYDHFESKEQLFIKILELIRDDLLGQGVAAAVGQPSPEDRIRGAVGAFLDFVQAHPEKARVLIIGSKGAPSIAEACRRVQAEATLRIVQLIKAQQSGLRSTPKRERQLLLTAEFVKKGMHGLVDWWLDHPDLSRSDVESALLEVLMNGLPTD